MRNKYTKELLEPVVKDSLSVAEVLKKLGLKATGGNHRHVSGRMKALGLDTSHFTGARWNKGKTRNDHESIARGASRLKHSNEQVFVQNSTFTNGAKLRQRLLELGWKYACAVCSLSDWLGKPLVLHVDHINGVHTDNRLNNLRFLCPNCHQQTDTWGNRAHAGVAEW